MYGTLRLFDYRCFRREQPATLKLSKGFTSFIGPNNAGKSALLKSLYELRAPFSHITNLKGNPGDFLLRRAGFHIPSPVTDPLELVSDRPDPQFSFELEVEKPESAQGLYVRSIRATYYASDYNYGFSAMGSDDQVLQTIGDGPANVVGPSAPWSIALKDGRQYSTQPIDSFAAALVRAQYLGPFRNAVNEGAGTHYDLVLGTGFIAQWHQWKTGGNKLHNRAIQEVTEDIRRLMGAQTLEINASVELKTLQVVIDRKPYKLGELGAGMSQLIVVLGSALILRPSFIAIDEPETHLHPSLQADFLTSLAAYAQYGVLFATHSIGLARASADQCFSVQKSDRGSLVRRYEETPNYAEFLGSLGIAGLRELGWDHILLVEGTTDVRTFQEFLKKYSKDKRVVVLPLGGSSLINGRTASQLSEVLRLSDRVSAVIDSEKASMDAPTSKERIAFSTTCGTLGIRCLVTERRATENYLCQRAIGEALGSSSYVQLEPFAAPTGENQFWGKSENWRIARAMSRDELEGTDLGGFLAEL